MNTPGAEPRSVRALIEQQARERPDAIYALAADGEAVLRYGQLERDCRAVGELLSRHGVRRGDTVSIVVDARQETGSSSRIFIGVRMTPTPEQLVRLIRHAEER